MSTTSTPVITSARELFERAVAHHVAGRTDAAIPAYREAIALEPTLAPALNNLGAVLGSVGRSHEALPLFERAVAADPSYGEARNNLGLALGSTGKHRDAIPQFEAAIALEPTRAPWWNNLGNSCVECFLFDRALEAYDTAIGIESASADVWSNRGLALRGLRRPDEAIASFERALTVDARFVSALVNLGIVLKEQKRTDAAIAAFEKARSIRPDDAALLCNFASVYEARGEYERMRELADLAAQIDQSSAEPHVLRGNYHMERGDFAAAESAFQHARSLDAENRNANWNLALIWLLNGDYRRGWAQFAWRKRLQSVLLEHNEYPGDAWNGEPLRGRSILLHSEQGLGDAIQFVRYASELKSCGAGRVIVESPIAVTSLLATARGVDEVIARGAALPPFDVHASLMDLPALCGTDLDSIPASVPYLDAPPRPVAAMVNASEGELKVGVVWAGNPMHQRDHLRSVPFSQFSALFEHRNARFFSLQKGGPEAELMRLAPGRVADLSTHLADFRDTAAAIAQLDLVITVDTSVAHLAGALGVETWILVTHVPDFRWMLARTDSPWYPTARLFRQPAPRDWATVITDVRQALDARAGAGERTADRPRDHVEPVTMLSSAARRTDGRPLFELSIALADLADPSAFASYERELVSGGDDAALRAFLSEALRGGDILLDPAPGLGATALHVAAASAGVTVHVSESDSKRVARLRQAAREAAASNRLVVHPGPLDAGALGGIAGPDATDPARIVVRIGDASLTPELLGPLTANGETDIAAVVWSSAAPREIAAALTVLAEHGFWLGTITLQRGEVTLDPLSDIDAAQTVIAIEPPFLAALGADLPGTAIEPAVGAVPHGAFPNAASWLAFDWEVRGDTGWGIYGLNLATQLAARGDPAPIVLACDESTIPPLMRHRLSDTLAASMDASNALRDPNALVTIDGTLLRAFGNGFVGAPHASRLRAERNVGVVFFEDTHFDRDAIARAQSMDAVIAGSSWNAEVLRACGVDNVRTVIQGIDPTIFHPAPSTGLFRDRFVIFSGGKLEYRKGQDIVIAAFRRFLERHSDALLITAWHNHWPQLITDLELAGHVRGTPRAVNGTLLVRDWLEANGIPRHASIDVGCAPNVLMGQIVREADVALFPNRCEGGTNLVAMECMAAGVPTIVSSNTGHLDLTATGGCFSLRTQRNVRRPTAYFTGTDGWGESDVDEIVDLLERLYADRAIAKSRAALGVDAMSRLTWSSQIEALLNAIGS